MYCIRGMTRFRYVQHLDGGCCLTLTGLEVFLIVRSGLLQDRYVPYTAVETYSRTTGTVP